MSIRLKTSEKNEVKENLHEKQIKKIWKQNQFVTVLSKNIILIGLNENWLILYLGLVYFDSRQTWYEILTEFKSLLYSEYLNCYLRLVMRK